MNDEERSLAEMEALIQSNKIFDKLMGMDSEKLFSGLPQWKTKWKLHPKWRSLYRLILKERFRDKRNPTESYCVIITDGSRDRVLVDCELDGVHLLTFNEGRRLYDITGVWNINIEVDEWMKDKLGELNE